MRKRGGQAREEALRETLNGRCAGGESGCILVGVILGDEVRLSQFVVPNLLQGVDRYNANQKRAFLPVSHRGGRL